MKTTAISSAWRILVSPASAGKRTGATLLLWVGLALAAAPSAALPASSVVANVDAVFAEWNRDDSPGCALGVIRDRRFVLQKGYGMANLEHGVPITEKSVFRIGSVSKQFAAFVVMLAAERGELSLDAGIRTYLPELPAVMEPVTVRHLVHHTSGVRDYLSLMSLAGRRDEDWYTEEDVMELLARQENLNFPPGTEYLYSNSGYFLFSRILPRVTGSSLREYAREHVFDPLGMRATHFHDDFRRVVPGRAHGYRPREEGGFEIDTTTLNMVGDGGIFTSIDDLLAWDRNFETGEIGGDALRRRRIVPGRFRGGASQDYAAGLRVGTYRGLEIVEHGGAFVGYRAAMLRFPEKRFSVYVLCNNASAAPSRYAKEIAELYLDEEFPLAAGDAAAPQPHLKASLLEASSGLFWSEDTGGLIRIERDGDGLLWKEREARLAPLAEGVFAVDAEEGGQEIRFVGEGANHLVVSSEGQRDFRYRRVEPVELGLRERVDYLGAYECRELGVVYHVELDSGDELVLRLPYESASMTPAFREGFRLPWGTVHFQRDAGGRPSSFELSAFRARNFRFVRR